MLEGSVKTKNIRIDTKHRITVTYMLEGRMKTITIRIDTKKYTVRCIYTDGEVVHSSL
jgi:hypothetical protein